MLVEDLLIKVLQLRGAMAATTSIITKAKEELDGLTYQHGCTLNDLKDLLGKRCGPITVVYDGKLYIAKYASGVPEIEKLDMDQCALRELREALTCL